MAAPTVAVVEKISAVGRAAWNACAGDDNPFVAFDFLDALEASGCVGPGTGWAPRHLTLKDADGTLLGAVPLYVKGHSQGEYVFDHGWAEAFSRAGGRYYPKLQAAVPFTPVTGPRLLVAGAGMDADARRTALATALAGLVDNSGVSSAHVTFADECDMVALRAAGFLHRTGEQFHWLNRDYRDFDDFLDALSSRKRKTIRRERRDAVAPGIDVVRLTGAAITEDHWDAFFAFYMDTGGRKWGRPYLNRAFFSELGARMADRVLLVMARRQGRWIAGALNLVGGGVIFGRNWGCLEHHPFLHFEVCYYQAIEHAIIHGLAKVEAGAQGEHKLARGYEPVATHSAHWIAHPGFRRAVADFLEAERAQVERDIAYLDRFLPFKHRPEDEEQE